MNPTALGESLGLQGDYIPTAKETELATREARSPGRYRSQILGQIYSNIESVLPSEATASDVMSGLQTGDNQGELLQALSVFAPKLAEVLIEDEAPNE